MIQNNLNKCKYCGGLFGFKDFDGCCSREHRKRFDIIKIKWAKKDLCIFDGLPKFINEHGEKLGVCEFCFGEMEKRPLIKFGEKQNVK